MFCDQRFDDAEYIIKIKDPSEMINDARGIISTLATLNIVEDGKFPEYVLDPIGRLAREVLCLPASCFQHHVFSEGLFMHSLKTALLAVQKLKNIARAPKKELYLGFIGGLVHDIGKICHMVIKNCHGYEYDPCKNYENYNPLSPPKSLDEWRRNFHLSHLHVGFKNQVGKQNMHQTLGAYLLRKVLPIDLFFNDNFVSMITQIAFSAQVDLSLKHIQVAINQADSEDNGQNKNNIGQFAMIEKKAQRFLKKIKGSIYQLKAKVNCACGDVFVLDDYIVVSDDLLFKIKRSEQSFDPSEVVNTLKEANVLLLHSDRNPWFHIERVQHYKNINYSRRLCVILFNRFFKLSKRIGCFRGKLEISSDPKDFAYSYNYENLSDKKEDDKIIVIRIAKALKYFLEKQKFLQQRISQKVPPVFRENSRVGILYPLGIRILSFQANIYLWPSEILDIFLTHGYGSLEQVYFPGERNRKDVLYLGKKDLMALGIASGIPMD